MFNGFNQAVAADVVGRGTPDAADRRRFLRLAALAGLGVAGVGALGATTGTAFAGPEAERRGPGDVALLNLLLNVSYLLAEFGLRGAYGAGLSAELVGGAGRVGRVTAGRRVGFGTPLHQQYVEEIATGWRGHVTALRGVLGPDRAGRPELDLDAGFSGIAAAAGLVEPGHRFDAFADGDSFLLGAFLLADLAVTATRGVAPQLGGAGYRDTASGLLAGQAYHAAVVRTMLLDRRLEVPAAAVADARAGLVGGIGVDQGVTVDRGRANAAPTDGTGLIPARSPEQVLNIVYLSPRATTAGGFFPWGVNGALTRSDRTT